MWVSDNGANSVFVITPTQLPAGGATVFSTTIESDPAFTGPLGIVLHNGNLCIANNGTTTIFEFNQNHLLAIGSGVRSVIYALKRKGRLTFVPFRSVIVNYVEDDLRAGIVEMSDHLFEFRDRSSREVTRISREEADSIVAPIVGQSFLE